MPDAAPSEPVPAHPPADLDSHYAWPTAVPWLRAVLVMTLEGADAGPDGRTRSISSDTDLAVLLANRAGADAVLIGAATLRAERYRPLRARPGQGARRVAAGQASAPRLVVVSASLDLPWSDPVFRESEQPVLVLTSPGTSPGTPPGTMRAPTGVPVEIAVAPGPRIAARSIVDLLHERGLRRVACEGGRTLLSQLAAAGLVDEWALTVSPLAGATRYRCASTWTDGGFLFTRFPRTDADRQG